MHNGQEAIVPKDAVSYGEDYKVTRDGTVYRYWRNRKQWQRQKPRRHSNGYLRGTIYGKDVYIHRLVAECFLDNPSNYKEVNHKDGDKTNNHVSNLEWCTRSHNNKHAFETGLRDYNQLKHMGERGGAATRETKRLFTDDEVRIVRQLHADGVKQIDIAKMYGVARQTIGNIVRRTNYAHVD